LPDTGKDYGEGESQAKQIKTFKNMLTLFNTHRDGNILSSGFQYVSKKENVSITFVGTITYTLTDPSVEDSEIESILKGAIKSTMI